MPAQISVYDPTAPFRSDGLQERILPRTLVGKTVGFIDNTKPNFDNIADDMAMLLKERPAPQAARLGARARSGHRRRGGQMRPGDHRLGRLRLLHVVECPRRR